MPCDALAVALNANRQVTGVLRGFDQFMNIVLDNTVDEKSHTDIGMVVSFVNMHLRCEPASPNRSLASASVVAQAVFGVQVIRGNSIVTVEVLERL